MIDSVASALRAVYDGDGFLRFPLDEWREAHARHHLRGLRATGIRSRRLSTQQDPVYLWRHLPRAGVRPFGNGRTSPASFRAGGQTVILA